MGTKMLFRPAQPKMKFLSTGMDVLALTYAASGQVGKARDLLSELIKLSKTRYVLPDVGVWAYCALGDTARVFECLEKAYEERSSTMPFLAIQPLRRNYK